MERAPGPGYAPGAPTPTQSVRKGIDPDSIPSPVAVQEADQKMFAENPYNTATKEPPPLASTKYDAMDYGNCTPRVMRSTLYGVPVSSELQKQAQIPFWISLAPFADNNEREFNCKFVDHGKDGPIRCKRCKAYLNPGVLFVDGGTNWLCNFCGSSNQVSPEYFCNLDGNGLRIDHHEKPELCMGSVEYSWPADLETYRRPPSVPSYMFVIEVSHNSVKSGVISRVTQAVRELLDFFPRDPDNPEEPSPVKIGFVTYDQSVHFYNLRKGLVTPQMMVVSDTQEPFVPLEHGLLVNINESREVIECLLDRLPHMFVSSHCTEPVMGSAVQAAQMAMQSTGGKLLLFQSSLCVNGLGKLKKRDEHKVMNSDKEVELFKSQSNFYKKQAEECVKNGIHVDQFIFPHSYMDVATMGDMSKITGGSLNIYTDFDGNRKGSKLIADIKHVVRRSTAFDAVMRVRCSTGLTATDTIGSFLMQDSRTIEMAGLDSDKCMAVQIQYNDRLNENQDAAFQCAMLYTTIGGQRRVRVHTLSLRICKDLADVFRSADMDALLNVLPRIAVNDSQRVKLTDIRANFTNSVVSILTAYRKKVAQNTASGQLILPESLKLLPVYGASILKSDALQPGHAVPIDARVASMNQILSMPVHRSVPYYYPVAIALHEIDPNNDKSPPRVRCSLQRLKSHGAYLVENGQMMFLWIGQNCNASWLTQALGVASFHSVDITMSSFPVLDTALSKRIRALVDDWQTTRQTHLLLHIAKQKDKSEQQFLRMMVEDEAPPIESYVNYLCSVHRRIQTQLQ